MLINIFNEVIVSQTKDKKFILENLHEKIPRISAEKKSLNLKKSYFIYNSP